MPLASLDFIQARGTELSAGGKPITLRGFGLPNYLNVEHFLLGLPGTDQQLRTSFSEVYGARGAAEFWLRLQACIFAEPDAAFLASIGVNSLRLPLCYRWLESDTRPGEIDPAGFAPIDRLIELCRPQGIYVVLDLHAAPGGQNPDWHSDNALGEALFWQQRCFQDRTIQIWQALARRYRDEPVVAAYDLINEPCTRSASDANVAAFQERALAAIREIDTRHLVFFEGDLYARDFRPFRKLDDPNLAYEFHYYPFIGQIPSPDHPPFESIEQNLEANVTLDVLRDRLGAPIWCGETGAPLEHPQREEQERLVAQLLDLCEAQGISWSLWTYKDARSMGCLHPTVDSPWMQLSTRACAGWDFWGDFVNVGKAVSDLERQARARLDGGQRRELQHRLLANRQILLSARFRDELRKLPIDRWLDATESFRFEACDRWHAVIDLVQRLACA